MPSSQECPPVEQLQQLAIGQLPDPLAAELEQHLLQCDECARQMAQWHQADALIAAMQQAGRGPVERSPEEQAQLERLMSSLNQAHRRRLAPLRYAARFNCPHCQNPIEIVADSMEEEVICPSCGSSLNLDTSRSLTWNKQRLPKIAQFELLEAVGRGAFGTVYKARDEQLQRVVAIKIPRSGVLATDEDEDRFVREARNAAQLRHPGIVAIHSVGRSDTFPYLVSEFAEGVTLSQYLTAKRFSVKDGARLIRDVALALQHAHEQGVVHRDLKPSNIMLAPDGSPRLMDFGCAKRDAGEVTMTLDGQILGTPAYMSPEQARGHAHQADPRSDVYSLGVILFQLLTGELPFRGEVRMLLHQVLHDEPPAPRKLNHHIPRDLDTICLKCLAKEPQRRYASAVELAEDIQRHLDGKPILARPVSRAERAWRWCRRNPVVASLSATAVTLLTLTAVVSTLAYVRESHFAEETSRLAKNEQRAREEAQLLAKDNFELAGQEKTARATADANARTAADEATRANREADAAVRLAKLAREREVDARWNAYVLGVNTAFQAWESAATERAHGLLASFIPEPEQSDLRGPEWYLLWSLLHDETATLRGHQQNVTSVAWSPDGKTIVSGSDDRSVIVWDAERQAIRQTLSEHRGAVSAVAFSPDGRWLATASSDGTVQVRDGETFALRKTLPIGPTVEVKLAFSPDSRFLATGMRADGVGVGTVVWETGSWREWSRLARGSIRAVAFSPDSQLVATSDDSTSTRVFDVETGRDLAALRGLLSSLLFSRDGRRLTSQRWSVRVGHKLWERDWASTEESLLGTSERAYINQLAQSPDQAWLALAEGDPKPYGALEIWDVEARRELCALEGHRGSVNSVAFAPDSRRLVSGGTDGTVRLWDLSRYTSRASPVQHRELVFGTAHSADGRWIATAGSDKRVIVWEASSGRSVWHSLLPGRAFEVAFSPDSQSLAVVFGDVADDGLRVIDLQTREFKAMATSPGYSSSVAYSPDGKWLAIGGGNLARTIQLLDAETGQHRRTLRVHDAAVISLRFSPDSQLLASGSDDQTACLTDVASGQVRHRLSGHAGRVMGVGFSPDQRLLATASMDGVARVWDTGDGRNLATCALTPRPPLIYAYRVEFRPDGTGLLVGFDLNPNNGGGAIAEYDTQDFQLRRKWERIGPMADLSLSPDGKRLCLGLFDGRALVWDAHTMTQTAELGEDTVRHAVAMSPTGRQVAISQGRKVVVRDAATGTEQYSLTARELPVAGLVFSPDGRWLVGAEGDLATTRPGDAGMRELQVWNAETGALATMLPTERRHLTLAFSPDGRRLASATAPHQSGNSNSIELWDVPTWKKASQLTYPALNAGFGMMLFLPDSQRLLLGTGAYHNHLPGVLTLWDTQPARQLFAIPAHAGTIRAALALADDQLLTAGLDSALRVWDLKTGSLVRTVPLSTQPYSMALLPEGRLAVGGSDARIHIWNMATWQELADFRAHPHGVGGLVSSPTGQLLVSISKGQFGRDGGERFWRLARPDDVQRSLAAEKSFLQTSTQNLTNSQAVIAPWMRSVEQARERNELDLPTYFLAARVLRTEELERDDFSREGLKLVQSASDGTLAWSQLKERFASLEQPQARADKARQQMLDRSELEHKRLIQELLSVAQANDNPAQGPTALTALAHLLRLDPQHAEARQLREKLAASFRPRTLVNPLGLKLTELRPGRFLMGSPREETGRDPTENLHPVRLTKAVFLADREVTRQQFAEFAKATGYITEAEKTNPSQPPAVLTWKKPGFDQDDSHPVVCVSWNDATAFCQWLSKQEGKVYRLPTEAEFEYATRAGSITVYSWGAEPAQGEKWANVGDVAGESFLKTPGLFPFNDAAVQTAAVGRYQANSWGFFDLTGNVREWCSDRLGGYPAMIADNPAGFVTGQNRIIRGGSWQSLPAACRAAARDRAAPESFADDLGFRVVREE